jgi:hypothetical protein
MGFRVVVVAAVGVAAISTAAAQGPDASANYKPPSGYVPDAATAIRIAVAVWSPIYGEKQIDSEKPYVASLKDKVWTVVGTFHCPAVHHCVDGVALAEISKQDGTILRVIHGQ